MISGRAIVRVVAWTTIAAGLGALGGLVFGLAFAGLGLLLQAASWSLVNVAGYLAACGATAGALVGACGSLLEEDTLSEAAAFSPKISDLTTDPIAVAQRFAPTLYPSRKRPAATAGTARSSSGTLASRKPSRN